MPKMATFQSTHSVGSGTTVGIPVEASVKFQSTHSVGSGTQATSLFRNLQGFQSTHSVGSGTRKSHSKRIRLKISIHPLRGEWDVVKYLPIFTYSISIHPLRGEWDREFCRDR